MGFGTKMAIGGALAGIGQGIVSNAQADIEAKRQAALAAMKAKYDAAKNEQDHQFKMTEIESAANYADRNEERKTTRGFVVDTKKAEQKFGFDKSLENLKFGNEKELASFKTTLDIRKDAAAQSLKKDIESGQVKDMIKSGDGQYYAVYADGRQVPTGISVPPPEKSGEPSTIAEARGAPKPAAKPAAPKPAAPATKPGGQAGKMPRISGRNDAEITAAIAKLPKGARFIGPDGKVYQK